MPQEDRLVTFKGIRLEDMTREQLIDAVQRLCRMRRDHYTPEACEIRALGRIEQLKTTVKA